MEWINQKNVLIVGLGLMGGSYARALSRLGFHVMALDKNKESILFAKQQHIIEEGDWKEDSVLLEQADSIIIALYPGIVVKWVQEHQDKIKSGAFITDVTGVKEPVVYKVQEILREDLEFIAAHPMAGREVYGVENSDDKIFRDANYIVVPTEKNTREAILWCENLGRVLGFRKVSILTPKEHDDMIAYVSQLTHCIAVALMTGCDKEHVVDYTGDSFRDLTRIANINEDMWSELFLMNKEPLLQEMTYFIDEMNEIKGLIEEDKVEELKEKMRLSTVRRSRFNK
ncbi:MAG: prephenate dehydrogenase [Lachnospiraceae bacterium]|nr:prephenate dehydrogenase [Lachnospiraceae bacterium]